MRERFKACCFLVAGLSVVVNSRTPVRATLVVPGGVNE
jgi:hypothetical protein